MWYTQWGVLMDDLHPEDRFHECCEKLKISQRRAQEILTPLEACLVNEIELINTAHADPGVRGLRLSSTRGGDESRRLPVVAAGGVNQTEAERGGEAVAAVQQGVPLIALSDLGSAVGKSRLMCEGLWGRAFLTAYNSANNGERLRMAEGSGKGAGLALLAVPMVEAFTFTQAQFQAFKLMHSFSPAYFVQLPRPGSSDKRSAYPPLRRRRDTDPHARNGLSSASMPSAWEEFSST